ncbi:head-to-tail stopper [Bacillus phage 056SW001B]|uniref:Head-to-tail stopper n=2 Tax=Gettysburgvirus TaxID=3425034 RepID=A0A5J6TA92_9CAUD|nr:head-to-tail stopper [Bacillus phage 019DV002]QFG05249.1 head-to-tail stopper [Bacillus phage 019DV004]QFR56487.1 head-to-tail stopper [Bacillus phage 056SW001B]
MASSRVVIHLNGVDKKLIRMASKIDDMRTPLKRSETYMKGAIARRFNSGGGSRPWKPLSPATIKRHPHRAGGKPLLDTGRLKNSVSSGDIGKITGKRLYISLGSAVKYAAAHNFGYKQIPKREFLYFDETDEKMIKRIFEDWVKEVTS